MRVGFEVSDLQPLKAGVYTYAFQLLRHMTQLTDAPELVLIDGLGRTDLRTLIDVNNGTLPVESAMYAQARALPLVRTTRGPWGTRYIGRLAWIADRYVLLPLWQETRAIPSMAQRLLPSSRAGHLDVCHWSDGAFLNLPGVAHVATIHDTVVLFRQQWQVPEAAASHRRKLRLIARSATRVIADSENTRRDTINLLGVPAERIDVIPLAAGPEFRAPSDTDRMAQRAVLTRYGLNQEDYILCVGTIEPRKNLVRLATAFKALLERAPDLPTRLVLAGGRGWLTNTIDQGLRELCLGARLVLPGRIPQADLPALLQGARVVAYVSLYEGFGLPALEALACGTPIVASNNSSLPEVVGDAGLLVDPYSVAEIAMALHRVVTDNNRRTELAARSLKRASQFSWEKTAEMTLQTYRRAVEMKRPATRGLQRSHHAYGERAGHSDSITDGPEQSLRP